MMLQIATAVAEKKKNNQPGSISNMDAFKYAIPAALFSATLMIIWIVGKWMRTDPLAHIPSPPGIPLFGNTFQISPTKARLTLLQWARDYGGVYRISTAVAKNLVILSSYDFIQEVLITKGAIFSDRIDFFRLRYTMKNSMMSMRNNDATYSMIGR